MMTVGHEHEVSGGAHHSLRALARHKTDGTRRNVSHVRQAQVLHHGQLPNT